MTLDGNGTREGTSLRYGEEDSNLEFDECLNVMQAQTVVGREMEGQRGDKRVEEEAARPFLVFETREEG